MTAHVYTAIYRLSGPEDKTLHYSIHPWPVLKPGQYVHVNLTFTPRKYISHTSVFCIVYASMEWKA